MSSFMSRLRNIFLPQDEYDDDDDEMDDKPSNSSNSSKSSNLSKSSTLRENEPISRNISSMVPITPPKVVALSPSNKMEILNFTMTSYEMTGEVSNYIKSKKPIVVNMEKLDSHEMQRAVDYLAGACCALNGTVEKVTDNIFIFAPEHVNINPEKIKQKNIFPPIM